MAYFSRKCHNIELKPKNFVKYYTNICQNGLKDGALWIII